MITLLENFARRLPNREESIRKICELGCGVALFVVWVQGKVGVFVSLHTKRCGERGGRNAHHNKEPMGKFDIRKTRDKGEVIKKGPRDRETKALSRGGMIIKILPKEKPIEKNKPRQRKKKKNLLARSGRS